MQSKQKCCHALICAAVPIGPTVCVNVLSALLGPFIFLLCVDANEASGHGNPMFLKSQHLFAVGDCTNLCFINRQKLPESLQVIRPSLEICRGRSLGVTATVGVISSGVTDPKPAWGCSSVLVKKMASLVSVQMTEALVKDISPPVESQVSSQLDCWPPECLWSRGGGTGVAEDEDRPGVGWGCTDRGA